MEKQTKPYYLECGPCEDEGKADFRMRIIDFKSVSEHSELVKEFITKINNSVSRCIETSIKKSDYEDGCEINGLHYPKASVTDFIFHWKSTDIFNWLKLISTCKKFVKSK